jgi:hypothetical protein
MDSRNNRANQEYIQEPRVGASPTPARLPVSIASKPDDIDLNWSITEPTTAQNIESRIGNKSAILLRLWWRGSELPQS